MTAAALLETMSLARNLEASQVEASVLESELRGLTSELIGLEREIDFGLAGLNTSPLAGKFATVSGKLSDVEIAVRALDSTVNGFGGLVYQIDQLVRCINDYMVTVGNARGGLYRYYLC